MNAEFGLEHHLWSFTGKPGDLLDRAAGEVAIDRLVAPVVTGPIAQFRLDNAASPRLFHTEGGWHFPPDLESYYGGTVRPRSARWFGKRQTLEHLAEFAHRRGLKLVCRVDLRSVTSLVEHEPHLRSRNAWGDADASVGACVLNPDLRELFTEILRDLEHYRPAEIQLVEWAPDLAIHRAPARPLSDAPLARALLDICFCPSCRQTALAAGVDPDQAARSACVHVETLLGDRPQTAEQRLADDEVLREYLNSRRRESASWLSQLAARYANCAWSLLSDNAIPAILSLAPESALSHLRCDGVTPMVRIARMPSTDTDDAEDASLASRLEVHGRQMRVWSPGAARPDRLVRSVSATARQCAGPIDFAGLEEAPSLVIDWLRQAVRFARRG